MTPAEWAEVFHAGEGAIHVKALDMIRDPQMRPELYGAAALAHALRAMEAKCTEIAERSP